MAFTTTTGANGVVSLVGTSGVDTATLTALTSQVYVGAQANNDVVVAAFANGTNLGSAFTVNGGAGNDTLTFTGQTLTGSSINGDGGTEAGGADTLTFGTLVTSEVSGGDANDAITFQRLQSTVVNGNAGVDTITINNVANGATILSSSIFGGQGNDVFVSSFSNQISNSVINGNKGDDTIAIDGSLGFQNSTIFGGQGSDVINFFAGTGTTPPGAVISGDLGNDLIGTLVGTVAPSSASFFSGRDTIDGGAGIDSITAGARGDLLTGGAGIDTFNQVGTNAGAAFIDPNAGGAISGAAGSYVVTFGLTGVDVITDFTASGAEADIINGTVAGAAGITTIAGATAFTAATVNLMRGTYNSGAGTFTQSATGADMLATTGGNALATAGASTNELTVLLGAGAQTFAAANFV